MKKILLSLVFVIGATSAFAGTDGPGNSSNDDLSPCHIISGVNGYGVIVGSGDVLGAGYRTLDSVIEAKNNAIKQGLCSGVPTKLKCHIARAKDRLKDGDGFGHGVFRGINEHLISGMVSADAGDVFKLLKEAGECAQ